jgi:hypothetical protein
MQEDSGPDDLFDKKRKAEDSNSVIITSEKRTKKGKSQSETGETVKAEPQWPDYFKEVSARENRLKLTLGNFLLSAVQGVFSVDPRMVIS